MSGFPKSLIVQRKPDIVSGDLVIVDPSTELTQFEPQESRKRLTVADAGMRYAAKVRDLALFEEAARAKVAEVRKLVLWWDANVRDAGNFELSGKADNSITADEAQKFCGFAPQRISEWRTRLAADDYAGEHWLNTIIARFRLKAGFDEIRKDNVVVPLGKFACIVIDPPWPENKIEREVRPNQFGFDYQTMSADELVDFGDLLNKKAADDCHLFCWATQKYMPLAVQLLNAWDFRYVCGFVWHKPGGFQPVGLPQYNCEFVIYGRRGSPLFIDTRDFPTCFTAPRKQHSRKPHEFYKTLRRVTDGPRLDMFSREPHDGFAQHGNEVDKYAAE